MIEIRGKYLEYLYDRYCCSHKNCESCNLGYRSYCKDDFKDVAKFVIAKTEVKEVMSELEVTKKALELACIELQTDYCNYLCSCKCLDDSCFKDRCNARFDEYLNRAREEE